jgi:hypothetical protein
MRRRDLVPLLTGAVIASPLAARAQQPMPLIGYLSVGSPETDNTPERLVASGQGVNEGGYIEGVRASQSNMFGHRAGTTNCLGWRPVWFAAKYR